MRTKFAKADMLGASIEGLPDLPVEKTPGRKAIDHRIEQEPAAITMTAGRMKR